MENKMENNNYENPYATGGVEAEAVVIETEKVSVSGAKKVWIVILSVWSLCNGVVSFTPLFLSSISRILVNISGVRKVERWRMPWEYSNNESRAMAFSLLVAFCCGVIAIIGFVMGLIAYKTSCKYKKTKVTTMAMIAKMLGLAGIIFNLLIGIISVINLAIN